MATIGESVFLKKTLMAGVVVAASKKENFLMVRAWDTDKKRYIEVEEHRLNMETLTIPEFIQHVNLDDKEDREDGFNHLFNMALDMNDKEWFDEITAARNEFRCRRPCEESEFEKNRVKPGQMVVDNNGKNSGIVLCAMKHRPGKFLIRTFNSKDGIYIQIERMASQLKVLKVPAWNKDVNYDFKETKEIVRELCSELAAATEDYEWLKELNKKEEPEKEESIEEQNWDGA